MTMNDHNRPEEKTLFEKAGLTTARFLIKHLSVSNYLRFCTMLSSMI